MLPVGEYFPFQWLSEDFSALHWSSSLGVLLPPAGVPFTRDALLGELTAPSQSTPARGLRFPYNPYRATSAFLTLPEGSGFREVLLPPRWN